MTKFKNLKLSHISNGISTQDGFDVFVVRKDGTEVWAATTGENLSQLQVEIEDIDVINAAREVILNAAPSSDGAGTAMTENIEQTPEFKMHVAFLAPERTVYVKEGDELVPVVQDNPWTDAEKVAYLWDALKVALSNV